MLILSFSVVGTVRSAAKGEELKKLHAQYGDKFDYAIIPDIVKVSLSLLDNTNNLYLTVFDAHRKELLMKLSRRETLTALHMPLRLWLSQGPLLTVWSS